MYLMDLVSIFALYISIGHPIQLLSIEFVIYINEKMNADEARKHARAICQILFSKSLAAKRTEIIFNYGKYEVPLFLYASYIECNPSAIATHHLALFSFENVFEYFTQANPRECVEILKYYWSATYNFAWYLKMVFDHDNSICPISIVLGMSNPGRLGSPYSCDFVWTNDEPNGGSAVVDYIHKCIGGVQDIDLCVGATRHLFEYVLKYNPTKCSRFNSIVYDILAQYRAYFNDSDIVRRAQINVGMFIALPKKLINSDWLEPAINAYRNHIIDEFIGIKLPPELITYIKCARDHARNMCGISS